MGVVLKFTMPLLSTLAALVIIVHSAEENYEREYREIRPRTMGVAPANYDQSWRGIEVEPAPIEAPQRNQERWDEVSPEQPMRRRRRKRKRRPNPNIQEETSPQEDFLYREAPQGHQQDTIEMPRRRRKKVDNQDSREQNRPTQYMDEERPLRRRGHRRKRPPVDSSPELSEFNDMKYKHRPANSEERSNIEDNRNNENENERTETKIEFYDQSERQFVEPTTQAVRDLYSDNVVPKDDISLSEFSSESKRSEKILNPSPENDKINDKKIITSNIVDKPKAKESLDPLTLKAILQKSNGKSLSEILQQNNLSLADLLHGKEKALSLLKKKDFIDDNQEVSNIQGGEMIDRSNIRFEDKMKDFDDRDKGVNENNKEIEDPDTTTDCSTSTETVTINNKNDHLESTENIKINSPRIENTTNHYLRRRFPEGVRRRLRMRPQANTTYKGQLSRDLITLSSIKYRTNRTKSREWKDILPTMMRRGQAVKESIVEIESNTEKITTTTTLPPEETTTEQVLETTTDYSDITIITESSFYAEIDKSESLNAADSKGPISNTEKITTLASYEDELKEIEVEVEKPKNLPIIRPVVNSSDFRRQAYNNRLKRKRLKQKTTTTELPDESGLKNIYGTSNYVSASEFIAKTHKAQVEQDDYSTLEDFMTTEAIKNNDNEEIRSKTTIKMTKYSISTTQVPQITTGETAKYEIEEILNDDLASARLSKILRERNMTLMELVEHRERGSSHVHLADIFHNTSREPNPPEPFLSKSLIEPISKETYPLRALLEASSHEAKTTTIDPINQNNNLNIPVVMDFGNNVNENGENMGIISLFNNFSRIHNEGQYESVENEAIIEGRSNKKMDILSNETSREGRMLDTEKESLSWNDLINLMQKNHQRDNFEDEKLPTNDTPTPETPKKISLDQESDRDSLIVMEDLQRLKDFDSRITSDELLEIKVFETNENQKPTNSGFSSNTKSVTVATASILGLALILFLLTYAILKWRQQNKIFKNKHGKEDECVPTPIFENRKGLKINSSTRSKSPMLSSSNIYTIDSIDTHAGNESPEYMWDTLRKPFQ